MASGENWTVGLALFSSFETLVIITCKVIRQNCVLTMLCCPQEAKNNPQGGTGSKSSHRKIRGISSETGEAVDKFVLTPPQLQQLPIKGATRGSTPALFSSNEPQRSSERGWECLRLLSLLLDVNKDFLPTRQSQTPDHLPGRTCLRIPQSWQRQAANMGQLALFSWPSIKVFTCQRATHKTSFVSLSTPPLIC